MGSWVPGGLVGRLVALIIVVGVAASCGGDESNSSEDATRSADRTDSANDNSGGDDLAWVPFGPNDPDIPTPSWPAYNAFAEGNCSALRDYLSGDGSSVGEFGRAMAAVCAAAIEGDQGQWDVAETAFGAADRSTLANDCLAVVVADLLSRAIDWHNRNPGKNPDVRFNRVADTTECGARDESDDDATDDETDTDDDETDTDDDETGTTDDETGTTDDETGTTDDETGTTDDTETEDSTTGDETSQSNASPLRMTA